MTYHCIRCDQEMEPAKVLDIVMIDGNDHVMEFESNQCKLCKKHIMGQEHFDKFLEVIEEMRNGKDEAKI